METCVATKGHTEVACWGNSCGLAGIGGYAATGVILI